MDITDSEKSGGMIPPPVTRRRRKATLSREAATGVWGAKLTAPLELIQLMRFFGMCT